MAAVMLNIKKIILISLMATMTINYKLWLYIIMWTVLIILYIVQSMYNYSWETNERIQKFKIKLRNNA